MLFGDLAGCLDINHFHRWIGRGFDPDQFGFWFNGLFEIFKFSHINEIGSNTEFILSIHSHISLSSSIYIIANYNVISGFENVEDGGSGTATAGECSAEFTVFDGR